MKITAINGSPKMKGSLSARIIEQMGSLLGEPIETYHAVRLAADTTLPETAARLLEADVLLVVFPLYVDGLPAPLVKFLTRIESTAREKPARDGDALNRKPRVFAIANCGFYEPEQNALALEMTEHFANRAGAVWGYGLGIGGGPMLHSVRRWDKGPAAGIYKELCALAAAMLRNDGGENVFVAPKFPRFMYQAMANMSFWIAGKRNGIRDFRARPYNE